MELNMAECVRKRKHREANGKRGTGKHIRKIKRFKILLVFVLCVLTVLAWRINSGLRESMIALSEARVKTAATVAMHDAVLLSLSGDVIYAEMLEVMESEERVYMLKTNTLAMNSLAAECVKNAQEVLSDMGNIGISIPLGTLTGVPFLSGRGPGVQVRFEPASAIKSAFESSLVDSGINQTLYRVNIVLTASVYVILPGTTYTIDVKAQAAIAESVIVGEVPNLYADMTGISEQGEKP